MELVTGKAGTDHISAADLAAMYRGLLIADDCVLDEGDKLSCTMLDANTAEIGTGSCMLQAHHARVDIAEQITFSSCSPGYKRNDFVIGRYTLGTGNIQGVYLTGLEGVATLGEPEDPTYVEGDIDGGDTLVEFPIWRIPRDGVNVGTPERVMPTIDTLQKQITSVRESVSFDSHVSSVGFVRESSSCSIRFYTDNGDYALDVFYDDPTGHMSFWKYNEQTQRWNRLWTV